MGDSLWNYTKWLMILLVWGILAYGIYKENIKIRQLLQDTLHPYDLGYILQALHQRNLQIWILLSLLLIVTAVNDLRRPAPVVTHLPEPVAAESPLPQFSEKPVLQTPATTSANGLQTLPFSDVTEFAEKNSKEQVYLDVLKQRYESWLITYYYLQKCGKASTHDLDFILGTLNKELKAAGADPTMQGNILLAANGSYNEMYSDIPCDAQHLASTQASYDAIMQQMSAPAAGGQLPQKTQ